MTIEQDSADALALTEDSRYLLIGSLCPNGDFVRPYIGALDVYNIDPAGRISALASPDFPLYEAILNFKTIDALAAFLV